MSTSFKLRASLLLLLGMTMLTAARADDTTTAYTLLMQGRVGNASSLLKQVIAANPGDGRAHLLLCRAALTQDMADPAVDQCQLAAAAMPTSSEAQMWLGRALGLKAGKVNPLSAMGLARRVRTAFERAVQLNPKDYAAASDLGEFYIAAPGVVGGGGDKAESLARTMMPAAPALAHRLLALRAEKNKDFATAEAEYKAAVDAGHSPQSWSDLALFYQRNHRPDDALAAAKQALAADRDHGPAEVDVASILTDAHRDPDLAITALRTYLASPNQTDEAPVFKAHLQLGRLLAARGDKIGARAEYSAAAALAPAWEPARKALTSL